MTQEKVISKIVNAIYEKGRWATTVREMEQVCTDLNLSRYWRPEFSWEIVQQLRGKVLLN